MTTRERLEKLAERLNAQALSTENAVSPTRRAKRAAVVKRAEARAIGEILARVRSLVALNID